MPDVAVVGSPAALASRRAAIQRKSQREAFAANERERWLRDQMTATDDVAREQQYKAKQATATTAALRRFKKEAAADRSAFDAEVRRKEAAFARVEEDRRQREAERLREAGRAAASFAEYSRRRGGGAAAPAVRLSARDERRLRDAFEAEWSKFERRAEGAALAVDGIGGQKIAARYAVNSGIHKRISRGDRRYPNLPPTALPRARFRRSPSLRGARLLVAAGRRRGPWAVE